MQKIAASDIAKHEGEILACNVLYNGQLLYQQNSLIDEAMVNRITELKDSICYVFSYVPDNMKYTLSDIMNDDIKSLIKNEVELIFNHYSYKNEDDAEMVKRITNYFLNSILNYQYFKAYLENLFIVNNFIFCHSIRVTVLSLILAIKANLNQELIRGIAIGSLLHDIGRNKLYLEFPILAVPNHKFNREELHLVEMVPILGFNEIKNNDLVPLCSKKVILFHNVWENYEASYNKERKKYMSFPLSYEDKKITPDQKDIAVNIVQAANCFDLFLIHYKKSNDLLSDSKRLDNMFSKYSGNMFSKEVYDLLVKHVSCLPLNAKVELEDGRTGIVYKHTNNPWNPILKLDDNTIINLNECNEKIYLKTTI